MNKAFPLFALALASALVAQPQRIIGFTANTAAPTSRISRQMPCDPPTDVCLNVLPAPSDEAAGGAAYDPRRRAVWHTEGTRIAEWDIQNCAMGCLVPGQLTLGLNSRIGGLTFDTHRETIYHVESILGTGAIATYRFGSAPCPQGSGLCRFPLPTARHRAGAIAFDQKRDLLYVAASTFIVGAAGPQNRILVFRLSNPCSPICTLGVGCNAVGTGLSSIRAMAYDECRDELHVSDGRSVSVQSVVWIPGAACPSLVSASCCPVNSPHAEFWYGFDLESDRSRRVGRSCLDRNACPNCPSMRLDEVGNPVVGNPAYGFSIVNAPSNGTGWVLLSPGSGCINNIPVFCGSIYIGLGAPPIVLGPVPLGGAGACGGQGDFGLPLANNFALCGFSMCAQGVVACPVTNGLGLTNGLDVVIGV